MRDVDQGGFGGPWLGDERDRVPSAFNFPITHITTSLFTAPNCSSNRRRGLVLLALPGKTHQPALPSVSARFRSFRICLRAPLRLSETIAPRCPFIPPRHSTWRKTTSPMAETRTARTREAMGRGSPTLTAAADTGRPTHTAEA